MSEIFVYGGTLDPIHSGHIGVIREVLSEQRAVLVAPTTQNPWKSSPASPLAMRIEMILIVLRHEALPISDQLQPGMVCVFREGYTYAADLVDTLRRDHDEAITWVTGPDIASEVPRWKDWDRLQISHYVAKEYENNLRGTEIRKGHKAIHPALEEYIAKHKLYGESPGSEAP